MLRTFSIAVFALLVTSCPSSGFSLPSGINVTIPSLLPIPTAALPNDMILVPGAVGQPWYVCQGYNGSITHARLSPDAFDLTVENSFGNDGCLGDQNASTDMPVYSPVTGTGRRSGPDDEFVCLSRNGGGSLLIGHLAPRSRLANGDSVVAGETVVGTVRKAVEGTAQGNYAHIHIEAHSSHDCSGPTAPFTADAGFRFAGLRDFPNSGLTNEWQTERLIR